MTTVAEVPAVLGQIKTTLNKARVEILAKLDSLVANTPLTPEGESVIDELRVIANALDAIVPDEPAA